MTNGSVPPMPPVSTPRAIAPLLYRVRIGGPGFARAAFLHRPQVLACAGSKTFFKLQPHLLEVVGLRVIILAKSKTTLFEGQPGLPDWSTKRENFTSGGSL